MTKAGKKHYALIGFANSGKSTLFNLLSANKQTVGNWSGVTVAATKATIELASTSAFLSDLPGLTSLNQRDEQGQDLTISQRFLQENQIDCLVNVVDVSQLSRQLYLTRQLLELGVPVIVVLNKTDKKTAMLVDTDKLSAELNCPVLALSAKSKPAQSLLKQQLINIPTAHKQSTSVTLNKVTLNKDVAADDYQCHREMNALIARVATEQNKGTSLTDQLDKVILHPLTGIPIFLVMMYLLFMFAINIGSAFIDFFDIISNTLFVSYPLHFLSAFNAPQWLLIIIEGIGTGITTVATFIPVIACLFIGLSLLESSGYLARAAFVVDSLMQKIGLPGKAFVPLIVGFGCTVPAVMSARVLDSERERITTVMMSPFMSCGARLPVYALFAAAFFPENGQNLVFILYLVGIAAAIFTGFLLKKTVLPGSSSLNIMELPQYEIPTLSYMIERVWQRTKGFVLGAGKTIVIVVCLLNFVNSIGMDGSFNNKDSENSILSQGAKFIVPVLAPMGVKEENWQAGVGIITGIFAKEVLVATFNSLYSPSVADNVSAPSLSQSWHDALNSIKVNLLGLSATDPLGMSVGDLSDLNATAKEQLVEVSTYQVMQQAFAGQLGAFSYLLFILLYTPCIAAMGAIKNEVGGRWAGFAGVWSFMFAYLIATLSFQIGNLFVAPLTSSITIGIVLAVFMAVYFWLKNQGRKVLTIPISVSYS